MLELQGIRHGGGEDLRFLYRIAVEQADPAETQMPRLEKKFSSVSLRMPGTVRLIM